MFTSLFVQSYASSVKKPIVIYIDPGHGGFDGGCETKDKRHIEKDITLNFSLVLSQYFSNSGYNVKLTRYTDQALAHTKKEDMAKRVELINQSNTLVYISIHVNSYPSPIVKGAQVFYKQNDEQSKLFSEVIVDKLKILNSDNDREPLMIKNKYLVDRVNVVGCLLELGFLSNPNDVEKLTNEIYIKDMALLVYLGIVEYLDYYK